MSPKSRDRSWEDSQKRQERRKSWEPGSRDSSNMSAGQGAKVRRQGSNLETAATSCFERRQGPDPPSGPPKGASAADIPISEFGGNKVLSFQAIRSVVLGKGNPGDLTQDHSQLPEIGRRPVIGVATIRPTTRPFPPSPFPITPFL